jgi:alpha-D-xyloside xylohydrolase
MKNLPYAAQKGFDWITQFENYTINDNELDITALTARKKLVHLTCSTITDHIWRYTFKPLNSESKAESVVIQREFDQKTLSDVEETNDYYRFKGSKLSLQIDRSPWKMSFLNKNRDEILSENPQDVDGLGRLFILPLGYLQKNDKIELTTQSFALYPDEHLFGLGEKFTRLDKIGLRIVSWTQDALGSTSERSHKNIPLLISTRGYGLFVNSSARITWELGSQSCQTFSIHNESNILDIYFIYGPIPAEILARYCDLTGYSPVPPKWSFGLWISSCGTYRDQDAVNKLISGLNKYEIPADVLHIDTWWMRYRKYCDFQWDRESFPTYEKLIAKLQKDNLQLSLWSQPYISIESEMFETGKKKNYFVKRENGDVYIIDYGLSLAPRPDGVIRTAKKNQGWNAPVAIVDFTNPEACEWYQNMQRPLLKNGISVFKTDFGEDVPEDSYFSNGRSGADMHNLYPFLYNKTVADVTRQEKGYEIVWARSGFAGCQRYPVCWSGDPAADFASLAATIRGGLSLGMSGIPFWSNDIGGYRGLPSPELYVRWAQFGLFCSHSRMHGDSPREPWYFGEKALTIVKKYIELRYQLFPYIYSTANEASRYGMPVIRAMPLAFPDDPNTYDKDLQFMLGKWLLIAPIYNRGGSRLVYFPKGRWIDFENGKIYIGPTNGRINAPLNKLPIFVRSGAIIPMMQKGLRIPKNLINPLLLQVYPALLSEYDFIEDEGQTVFECHRDKEELVFNIKGQFLRNYVISFKRKHSRNNVFVEKDGLKVSLDPKFINREKDQIQIQLIQIVNARVILND